MSDQPAIEGSGPNLLDAFAAAVDRARADRAADAPAPCTDPHCCDACNGTGGTLSGPCTDCYGTGHPHP